MNPAGMTEEQLMALAAHLGVSIGDLPPEPPPHVSSAPAALSKAAPPPPMSLSSKVGLGLLGAAAVPLIGYGAYRGYQHFTQPHAGEEAASVEEKAASALVTEADLAAAREAPVPTAERAAWAVFGF